VVRRATGGGAIHHGDELTFSLALDAEQLPGDVAAGYALLHDAVQRALADCGVPCERLARGHAQRARPSSPWCFADPGRDDLVTARGKLLGSAQRRVHTDRSRVLHHGSLVLHAPPLTPFVAAVADVRPVDAPLRQQLAERLTSRFAEVLGLEPFSGALTAEELALATRLQHERHEDPVRLRRR
jgi:lipoate-protein ligase A